MRGEGLEPNFYLKSKRSIMCTCVTCRYITYKRTYRRVQTLYIQGNITKTININSEHCPKH